MPLTSISQDPATLTLTVVGDFPVPQRRLWDAFADPRQLERFWGPPDYPATFTHHDFTVGGRAEYFLALPDNQKWEGSWKFTAVDPIAFFAADDGDGNAIDNDSDDAMPAGMTFAFSTTPSGARVTIVTRFSSLEAMAQTIPGMELGLRAALPQLDALLADSAGRRTVEVSVEVSGTQEEVWQAVATGPGISAWFVPTTFGEVEGTPVTVQFNFAPGMAPIVPITAWEPPRMFAAQGEGWGGSPPITTTWRVEPLAAGGCRVRVENSIVADSDAWDAQLQATALGWPGFFRTLRLYLTHFRGQPAALLQCVAPVPGIEAEAWAALMSAMGMHGVRIGEAWSAPADAPRLAGTMEHITEDPYDALLLCAEPGPCIAAAGVFSVDGQSMAALNIYHYGEDAKDTVERTAPVWQAWMQERLSVPDALEN
jgi:uncharacterized protein YndB with AHSA1/START domain